MKTRFCFVYMFFIISRLIIAGDFSSIVFEYKNDGINVYSIDKSFSTRIEHTYQGMYQISKNRTKMIVFTESESEEPYYNSVYYIDSRNKKTLFVMKNWQNAMSDLNINFLICQKDIKNPFNFFLYDFDKEKTTSLVMKVNNPEITKKLFLSVQIYRSVDKRFDFIIDLSADAYTVAEYGFSIQNVQFTEIYDLTMEDQTSYIIQSERSDFEIGW